MQINARHRYYVTQACLEKSLEAVKGALVGCIGEKKSKLASFPVLTFYSITSALGTGWRCIPHIALTGK